MHITGRHGDTNMPQILTNAPDRGLNSLLPDNMLDLREAAPGSKNILYARGLVKTAQGFAAVDLSSGLNSGEVVLAVLKFTEINGASHTIACTASKIYKHNNVTSAWNDITQSGLTMSSAISNPVSWVEVGHNDTAIYLDDNPNRAVAYHHLILCDGGLSNIQRWAGQQEVDFADLVGAGGYHDGTQHRALQVGTTRTRLLHISPYNYSSSGKSWIQSRQRIQWPTAGKIQTWTGTGSGFVDLLDTGGYNVWSAPLGLDYIIYQTNSIWSMNYVGGTTVFEPRPMIQNLGLLSSHLLVSRENIHYFIGNDYNVYTYYGGSVKKRIGDKIHDNLLSDFETDYINRAWMAFGPEGKMLWIFFVPDGSEYITKAYGYDTQQDTWTSHDFTDKYTSGGITAASLITASTLITGDSYQAALNIVSLYSAADDTNAAGDVTLRYGDTLKGDLTSNELDFTTIDSTLDFTDCEFSAGGLFMCFTTKTGDCTQLVGDDTDYSNKIIRFVDGSLSGNFPSGTHYFTVTDVSIVADAAGVCCKCYLQPSESTGTGYSDLSTDTPALDGTTGAVIFDATGSTYNQSVQQVSSKDALYIGDSDGYIYKFASDITSYGGTAFSSAHYTPVVDLELPDKYKRWPGILFEAKGTSVVIDWKLDNGSWTSNSATTLTSSFEQYVIYIERSSKRIQARFTNDSGNDFHIRRYGLLEPYVEENR